jgi:hypothetical protein
VSLTQHRGKVAALSRSRSADDPDLIAAKRALREARLADYIQHTVDEAPQLTVEQRTRLALLLSGGDAA